MSKDVLKIISEAMKSLGLAYGFVEYSGNEEGVIVYPYFTGEYTEAEMFDESGMTEATFLLTGFSRDSWDALEDAKERIERHFNRVSGDVRITDSGSAVAIFYAYSLVVPTGDAELKSIQINLKINEWKVI